MISRIRLVSLATGLCLALLAQKQKPPAAVTAPAAAERKAGPATAKRAVEKPQTAVTPAAPAAATVVSGVANLDLGLRMGPPRPMRVPPAEEITLANGLRALVSENHELPVVNLFAIVRAGSLGDPAGRSGLAEVTANAARSGGTASLTAAALQERLGALGATLESAVAESRAQFTLRVSRANFAAAAALLRDLLIAPRFDPEALETTLGQMHESIAQRGANPQLALNRIFLQRLYGGASAWSRLPEYDSLDNIGRTDIETFHRTHYVPGQTWLAMDGDVGAGEAKAMLQDLFGAWAVAQAEPIMEPEVPKPPPGAMLFADRNDLRLSGFVMGHFGGRASDPDLAAMWLLCDLLTSGREARLPAAVRQAGGWRADWSASWDPGFERPGEFVLRGTVEPAFTTQAISIARAELAKLREGAITDQEVESARTRLLLRLALRSQSPADQLLERAIAEFHGLPADLPVRSYQALTTLTKADVVRAAAQHLLPDQLVVVAGNSALFDKPLTTLSAKVEPVDLIPEAARPLKPRTDPADAEKGRLALVRMQDAMGGRAKLVAIQDVSIRAEGTTITADGNTPIKLWDRWMTGDIYRQDQEFGFVKRSIFYNGKIGWIGAPGVVAPLAPALLGQVRGELFRLPVRLALSDQDPARQVSDLGGNVLQITEGDKQGIRIYLDAATGLPQRLLYRLDFGNGVSVSVEEQLSDWKEFDGVKWPTRISSKRNGRRADDLTVVEAKFNGALQVADLEKKP